MYKLMRIYGHSALQLLLIAETLFGASTAGRSPGADDGRQSKYRKVKMVVNMMTALEKRYQVSIDKIGHERLLNLPKQIKELLQNTKDLKAKTEMLEEIAKII